MKRNVFLFLLTACSWLAATTARAQDVPEVFQQDDEGYILLSTVEDVETYAEWVNSGGEATTSRAKLTADIDYKGASHTPIGNTEGIKFNGTFDGQGHRILNMIIDEPDRTIVGFFGGLRGGTQVRNLIIDKSCSITGKDMVGGIAGMAQTPVADMGPIVIENCVNEATVTATTKSASGIIGAGKSAYADIIMRNCVNAGEITGAPATAFCSWNNRGGCLVQNCLNVGTIHGADKSGNKFSYYTQLFRYEPGTTTLENVFDLSETDPEYVGQGLYEDWLTDNPLMGELCYMLNGDQSNIVWYQKLDEENSFPMPFYIEGGQVYLNAAMGCDGQPLGEASYSNSKTTDIPPHEYEDGICINCGHLQLDYAAQEDGFYLIDNASKLYWFSMQVNVGRHYAWNAKLTANIDMMDYEDLFQSIGSPEFNATYSGTFDGQGHVISNLHLNTQHKFTGLIGQAGNGLVVKNLLLDESCSISGVECVALVGGANQMTGTVTLQNLGNMGNVFAMGNQAAGIFGGNAGSKATLHVENCFSTGAIEGTDQCAALIGWAGSNNPTVTNCWSCSEVTGNDKEEMYFSRGGNLTNCYCTYGTQTPLLDYDDVESGALCFRLNKNLGDDVIVWYQNIDKGARDYNPFPFSNGHAQVFPVGKLLCDGSVIPGEVTYSNTSASTRPDHDFHEGFCSVCGQEDLDYAGFLPYITNPDYENASGWTNEGAAMTVSYGVAEHYNHVFNTYQQIDSIGESLPVPNGVYKIRVQGFSRLAQVSDETAYEDGMLCDDLLRNSYYYAESAGQRVARRFVDITAGKQGEYLNEGNGEVEMLDGTFVPDGRLGYSAYFNKGLYWNKPLYVAVTDGTLRIGVSNKFYTSGCTTVWDRWRIEYVGDDDAAYALIAKQTAEEAQRVEELTSQKSLIEEYVKIVTKAAAQTERATILSDAHKASILPDSIKYIAEAYVTFDEEIKKLAAEVQARTDLSGEIADILTSYLTDDEAPCEAFPNGSYAYIMENCPLNAEELAAELKFAQELYAKAVASSVEAGSDVTALLKNPSWAEAEQWAGWNHETFNSASGWNLVYRGEVPDVAPIVAAYNTAFDINQEVEGLKDGLYELHTNAWYRPGQGGEGDLEGYDIVPVEFYMNEFATPIPTVYNDILDYDEAINGVNCRYDATGDASAPHNGEFTNRVDRNTGLGYIPDDAITGAFAFHGGRYAMKAYAVVEGGKLKVGIRHLGTPWANKNLSVWGGLKLIYCGQDEAKLLDAFDHYEARIERLEIQRTDVQEYLFSRQHTDRISALIQQGRAGSAEAAMQALKDINAELATIAQSHAIFAELANLGDYLIDLADNTEDIDISNEYAIKGYELQDYAYDGSLSDEEARALINEMLEDPFFGGVYVQGDVYAEEAPNGEWPYKDFCNLYPLTKNAEGKYVGIVTLQNRTNMANSRGRAGFYISRMNKKYRCADAGLNFITPAQTSFRVSEDGADFQALNGTYEIVFDLEAQTLDVKLKGEYEWNNQVYVSGTLVYDGGTHRWANNEAVPLQHVGNGKYVGTVDLVLDNANPYCSFGILACRSTESPQNYSGTGRSSWTEARYGSEEQYLEIESGQKVEDLVRGLDRTWRIAPAGKYLIEFDMNNRTMTPTLLDTEGKGTEAEPYLVKTIEDLRTMQDKLVKNRTTYFRLENDFDLTDMGWWPLNNECFGNSVTEPTNKAVVLDGNNHVISNLKPATSAQNEFANGFFGTLVGEVKNLGFYNANIEGGIAANVGVLAGKVGNESTTITSTIDGCYAAGALWAEGNAGGLVGTIESAAAISNVYTVVRQTATEESYGMQGGIVGAAYAPLTLTYAYAAGEGAATFVGEEDGAVTASDVFVWDNSRADELCQLAASWTAWANDGKVGNGHPLLQWQVARGDYKALCGFYETTGIDAITSNTVTNEGIYNLAGQRLSRLQKGLNIVGGRKVMVK